MVTPENGCSLTDPFCKCVLNSVMPIPFIILVPMMTIVRPYLIALLYLTFPGTVALFCFLSHTGLPLPCKSLNNDMWSSFIIVGVNMFLQLVCARSMMDVFIIISNSFRTFSANKEYFKLICAADSMMS